MGGLRGLGFGWVFLGMRTRIRGTGFGLRLPLIDIVCMVWCGMVYIPQQKAQDRHDGDESFLRPADTQAQIP